MNIQNLMKDPKFQDLMYRLESRIHDFDERAKSAGIVITDTNVKSVIRKFMGVIKGKSSSSSSDTTEVDRAMIDLTLLLVVFRENYDSEETGDQKLGKKDWLLLLKALEDTLKMRREMYGHSRGYLDFLKGFLEEGRL